MLCYSVFSFDSKYKRKPMINNYKGVNKTITKYIWIWCVSTQDGEYRVKREFDRTSMIAFS